MPLQDYYGGPFTSILLGVGNGQCNVSETVGYEAYTLLAADFNGDGKIDLTAGFWTALGNGDGTLGTYTSISAGNVLGAGEFDQDGNLDIVTSGITGILLGNGDGTFQPVLSFVTGGSSQYAVVADFNGDGKPDVALTGAGANYVTIMLNTTGSR